MASTTCWNCARLANMTPIPDSASTVAASVLGEKIMGCFRCDGCSAPNIAIAIRRIGQQDPLAWLAGKKQAQWTPRRMPSVVIKTFPDVPAEIAGAASEAFACLSTSPRAAVLMARGVIEATAKAKGITKGKLIDKIDAMSDLIRPHVRDGAHEIRLLGNDVAHGDFLQRIAPEDATLVLTLMSEVLDDVYQSPARVAKAQADREERRESDARIAKLLKDPELAKAISSAGAQALQAAVLQNKAPALPPAQGGQRH